jgi:hypothetical protein
MSETVTATDVAPVDSPQAEVSPSPAQMPQHIAAAPPAPVPAAPPAPSAPAPVAAPSAEPEEDDFEEDLEAELPRDVQQARKLRRENRNLRQRAQAADDYRQRFEAAQASLTRYEVAAAHGITNPESIALIGSGSREDMERNAAYIAQLHQASATVSAVVPPPSNRPVEGLRPGASPEPPAAPDDAYPAAWTPTHLRTNSN